MEFNKSKWTYKWENFENYIYSDNKHIDKCWEKAESLKEMMPMFKNGVKEFWKKACYTTTKDNNVSVDTWNIKETNDGLEIEWTLKDGSSFKYNYHLDSILEKGLENKESYIFVSDVKGTPFTYLIAMEPMPDKSKDGLLPHLHFQYGKDINELIKDNKLINPMWYATMVDEDGTLLQKCNLLNALHRLPALDKLDD